MQFWLLFLMNITCKQPVIVPDGNMMQTPEEGREQNERRNFPFKYFCIFVIKAQRLEDEGSLDVLLLYGNGSRWWWHQQDQQQQTWESGRWKECFMHSWIFQYLAWLRRRCYFCCCYRHLILSPWSNCINSTRFNALPRPPPNNPTPSHQQQPAPTTNVPDNFCSTFYSISFSHIIALTSFMRLEQLYNWIKMLKNFAGLCLEPFKSVCVCVDAVVVVIFGRQSTTPRFLRQQLYGLLVFFFSSIFYPLDCCMLSFLLLLFQCTFSTFLLTFIPFGYGEAGRQADRPKKRQNCAETLSRKKHLWQWCSHCRLQQLFSIRNKT